MAVISYVGGFTLRRLQEKLGCSVCMQALTSSISISSPITAFKSQNMYSVDPLLQPSASLSAYFHHLEETFRRNIKQCIHLSGVIYKISQKVTQQPDLPHHTSAHNEIIKSAITDSYFTIRIQSFCRDINKSIHSNRERNSKIHKLNIDHPHTPNMSQ